MKKVGRGKIMDLFGDRAVIFNPLVLNSYYGMLMGQIQPRSPGFPFQGKSPGNEFGAN